MGHHVTSNYLHVPMLLLLRHAEFLPASDTKTYFNLNLNSFQNYVIPLVYGTLETKVSLIFVEKCEFCDRNFPKENSLQISAFSIDALFIAADYCTISYMVM